MIARHGSGVGAEDVLECAEPLAPQLVPIADEERPAELAGIADALEQIDRDAGLPGARGEREERALPAARELLQHGPDRGILIVAARAFLAAGIARDKGTGLGRRQVESHGLLIASTELGRCRELGERAGRRCQAA